jgi:plastocyanin
VRWEFVARDKHDVVSNDRSFVSELVYGGTTYTHIFDEAGDYSYLCSIHPEMVGLVTVTE